MQKIPKRKNWKNILFIILIVVVLLPQTRTPIQVGLNRIKAVIFSPSKIDKANQQKIDPFTYKLKSIKGDS